MNISVVHHFELAITFGAPLPYIRRAYLIAAPRTMHHLQYAAIPGYFPAMAVFSAYFHLSRFVSYSSIVLNICNATCGTMAFPQALIDSLHHAGKERPASPPGNPSFRSHTGDSVGNPLQSGICRFPLPFWILSPCVWLDFSEVLHSSHRWLSAWATDSSA